MAADQPGDGLLRLLAWLSPAMPTGAFTYSHGLEAAVEMGDVRDGRSLRHYVEAVLAHGAGRRDALWLKETHGAVVSSDRARALRVAADAMAMRGTAELALESAQPGRSLLDTLTAAWPAGEMAVLQRETGGAVPYACALGAAAAAHGIALDATVRGFLHALSASLVSAGVRLIPLGQVEGQRVIAALEPMIDGVAGEVIADGGAGTGTSVPVIDLLSIAHERQYTRLFRS